MYTECITIKAGTSQVHIISVIIYHKLAVPFDACPDNGDGDNPLLLSLMSAWITPPGLCRPCSMSMPWWCSV